MHHPARAEQRVRFLVGGERHFHVHLRPRARRLQRAQRQQEARDRAFHVRRAAPELPAAVHRPAERMPVPPFARHRHHIVVRIEVHGLRRARRREFPQHVESRKPPLLWRQVQREKRVRHAMTLRLQAARRKLAREQRRDRAVVFARRVHRADVHQSREQRGQVVHMRVEVVGRSHSKKGPRFMRRGKIPHTASA